jgi:hypothetical protein
MPGPARYVLVAAALLGATAATASAQPGEQLPAPRAATLGSPTDPEMLVLDPGPWPPPEYRLPPVAEPPIPSRPPDPLLDLPQMPPPGWFANVEIAPTGAHVKDRLGSSSVGPTPPGVFHVPPASLNWTPAPCFEVGYRAPDGFGEFLLSYRFLVTEGASDAGSDAGPLHLASRLDVNVFKLDYANRDPLWLGWEMRWRVGAEVASVFFDDHSSLTAAPGSLAPGTPIERRASSSMVGAGPHAGLELWHRLSFLPGLALYGAADAATLYGHIHQEFGQTLAGGGGGTTISTTSQGVGVLEVQLGLSWAPPGNSRTRFFLGYQFEEWWQVGRNDNSSSEGYVTEQGIFLRGEFTF